MNVSLQFESNLHTLPPHFELKTEHAKEMIDADEPTKLKEKSNYYIVLKTNGAPVKRVEEEVKAQLPLHKSLNVIERNGDTAAVVVKGTDVPVEQILAQGKYPVEKVYPVEGV